MSGNTITHDVAAAGERTGTTRGTSVTQIGRAHV